MSKTLKLQYIPYQTICNTLGVKSLTYPKKSDKDMISMIYSDNFFNVMYVNINNNNFTSSYVLIEEIESDCFYLTKTKEGNVPLFSISSLIDKISNLANTKFNIKMSKNSPWYIKIYNTFKSRGDNYTLISKQNTEAYNAAPIDIRSFDDTTRSMYYKLYNGYASYSQFLRTDKSIKLINTGSQKETYFHETHGGVYPRFISEVPSFRYRHKDSLDVTESWYSGDLHHKYTSEAPEPEGVIYKSVWNNDKKIYEDHYVADCKITQEKQQNLVDKERQIGLNLFYTKNLKFHTKEEGDMLFPVSWKPKSYKEHNLDYAEPLTELTLWLNKYLRAQLIENVYSSLEEFLKYNKVNSETFSKEKAEIALTEIAKALCINSYFWLHNDNSIAIYGANRKIIHEIPVTNTSVLYEDSYIDDIAEETKEVVEAEEEIQEVQKVQKIKRAYVWIAPKTPKSIIKRIKSKYEFTDNPSEADIALAVSDGIPYISLKVFRGISKKNKLKLEYYMYRL